MNSPVVDALIEAEAFLDSLLNSQPGEALDLLTNQGEDLQARMRIALGLPELKS